MNRTVEQLKVDIFAAEEAAKGLEGSGLPALMERNSWEYVCQLYMEMVAITDPNTEDGAGARIGAINAVLKAKGESGARAALAKLLNSGNITPRLFEALQLLFRDGRGSE